MKKQLLAVALMSGLMSMGAYAGHHGSVLTNSDGMTLYTFDKDKNAVSNCYGGCAKKWPPFIATNGKKVSKDGWGVTVRKDGAKQWTFNNQPLYTWVGDTKAGDTTGNGVGGVWHTAEKAKTAPAKAASSSYSSDY